MSVTSENERELAGENGMKSEKEREERGNKRSVCGFDLGQITEI